MKMPTILSTADPVERSRAIGLLEFGSNLRCSYRLFSSSSRLRANPICISWIARVPLVLKEVQSHETHSPPSPAGNDDYPHFRMEKDESDGLSL